MTLAAAWQAIKTFGPWIAGALLMAALGMLVVDRDRLATLNNQHNACLVALVAKQPVGAPNHLCDAPIADAAEAAAASASCNTALGSGDSFAASQACAGPTKSLIADRDSKASEVANLTTQLANATADRDAAVARAAARATASVQDLSHAQSILGAAPHDGAGLSSCNADCLRQLAGAAP